MVPRGGRCVLANWLPFLIYALFAAAIPASMIAMSFVLPGRPVAANAAEDAAVRIGRLAGPSRP